jgi:hypothetical protein
MREVAPGSGERGREDSRFARARLLFAAKFDRLSTTLFGDGAREFSRIEHQR